MCRGHRAYRRMMVTMRLWDVLLWKASQRGLVVLPPLPPPPSAPIPLLLTMLHIINQLWVGLPCKYPNESSFIKWLNGPDKSPNEEINNSVIVTLLILIRPSCSALIPAKRRSFFTVFSSACQHCCRFFFFSFFCPWSFVMNCALLLSLFLGKMKRLLWSVGRLDAAVRPRHCFPWCTFDDLQPLSTLRAALILVF